MDSDTDLPPENVVADLGNMIGAHALLAGDGSTLVASNPNPDRGGTQLGGKPGTASPATY